MSDTHRIEFINNSTELDFEIHSYDLPVVEYKVLMDFIETFAVGDIFTVSA